MLQESSSRKRTIENFKEKADSVAQVVDSKNINQSAQDVVTRYDLLISNLTEIVNTNEKCLENVQQFLDNLKQFRDNLKQLWETLSSYTGLFSFLIYRQVREIRD